MHRFFIVATVVFLGVIVLVYGGASWYMASQVTVAERNPLEATPASAGLTARDVSFAPRGDDEKIILQGWHITARESRGTVIILHGVDSNRADPDVGYLDLARDLATGGFGSLLLDLRGHGESGGDQVSGGLFEQRDLLGAFDFLVKEGVPPQRIGVLGVSLGGAIALLTAAKEPRIRAVVADSTFADLSDLVVQEARKRTSLPGWLVPTLVPGMVQAAKLVYGIDIKQIAPIEAIEQLDYPVLLIHGVADERIDPSDARRLAEASLSPGTRFWFVPGAEHARAFKSNPQEYAERVIQYFDGRFSGD